MRKPLLIILALSFVLIFGACGSANNSNSSANLSGNKSSQSIFSTNSSSQLSSDNSFSSTISKSEISESSSTNSSLVSSSSTSSKSLSSSCTLTSYSSSSSYINSSTSSPSNNSSSSSALNSFSNSSSSTNSNTSNSSNSFSSSTQQNLVIDPLTGLPDYSKMQIKATAELSFKELGIALYDYKVTTGVEIANFSLDIKQAKHNINLYNAGTMSVTGNDCFGNTASFTITVNNDFTYNIQVLKPTNDFFEVNQFRYDDNGKSHTDHDMIQAAIDAANTKYTTTKTMQTVFVYPAKYTVSNLVMKEGVILDMYTTMQTATNGFSTQLASDVANYRCAVLIGGRIMNAPNQTSGYKGYGNFIIRGGVLDMNGKGTCFMILGCADNVIIENVVFKDIYNNHAVQLTACTNTIMRNCMFAGFRLGNTFTREVVQVEHAASGSTGSTNNGNIPPLTFDDNDPRFSENVTIDKCYFGKSDEYGAPWMAIGHHSGSNVVKHANVTTLNITNNVFDDCIYAGIRYNSVTGLTISGNKFITTSANNYSVYSSNITTGVPTSNNVASMIIFYHRSATYDTGMQNLKIENNTFDMGTGVDRRVVYFASNTSYNETVVMQDNFINFNGSPTYNDYHVRLTDIVNLTYKNNIVTKPISVAFSVGVYTSNNYEDASIIDGNKEDFYGKEITVTLDNNRYYSISATKIKTGLLIYTQAVFNTSISNTLWYESTNFEFKLNGGKQSYVTVNNKSNGVSNFIYNTENLSNGKIKHVAEIFVDKSLISNWLETSNVQINFAWKTPNEFSSILSDIADYRYLKDWGNSSDWHSYHTLGCLATDFNDLPKNLFVSTSGLITDTLLNNIFTIDGITTETELSKLGKDKLEVTGDNGTKVEVKGAILDEGLYLVLEIYHGDWSTYNVGENWYKNDNIELYVNGSHIVIMFIDGKPIIPHNITQGKATTTNQNGVQKTILEIYIKEQQTSYKLEINANGEGFGWVDIAWAQNYVTLTKHGIIKES